MERNYYLDCQLRGGFSEFTVETTKRKDKKKVCTKSSNETNQFLYRLFYFCLFLRWDGG